MVLGNEKIPINMPPIILGVGYSYNHNFSFSLSHKACDPTGIKWQEKESLLPRRKLFESWYTTSKLDCVCVCVCECVVVRVVCDFCETYKWHRLLCCTLFVVCTECTVSEYNNNISNTNCSWWTGGHDGLWNIIVHLSSLARRVTVLILI